MCLIVLFCRCLTPKWLDQHPFDVQNSTVVFSSDREQFASWQLLAMKTCFFFFFSKSCQVPKINAPILGSHVHSNLKLLSVHRSNFQRAKLGTRQVLIYEIKETSLETVCSQDTFPASPLLIFRMKTYNLTPRFSHLSLCAGSRAWLCSRSGSPQGSLPHCKTSHSWTNC